jgi:molybdopterin-guanine dinucleotide biosynthesis protein A
VLLAAGKSSRMGCDKAALILGGVPLWQRALFTLRSLNPHELFISGRADGPYAGAGIEIVPDITPGLGPLSGLEAALTHATMPLVIVLAVDLPFMSADFLSRLIHCAGESGAGVVPRAGEWFEPLVAIYSRRCLSLVQQHLQSEDRSMQAFVRKALSANLITVLDIPAADCALFRNLNTPGDLLDR